MIRLQLSLPDDLHKKVKNMAKQEGVSYSQIIRESIKEILKKYKSEIKKLRITETL